MSVEESRYFFNYQLPDIIKSNLSFINQFLNDIWWLFFIIAIFFFLLALYFSRRYIDEKNRFNKFDNFFDKLSSIDDLNQARRFLLYELKISHFSALYQLRGDTYILLDSNSGKKVSPPLRISKRELNTLDRNGRYFVSYVSSSNENFLLLFFTLKEFDIKPYKGHINFLLTYHERNMSFKDVTVETGSIVNQTTISLMKLHMDKKEFFRFLVLLIMQATNSKGVKLLTKENKIIFEKIDKNSTLQKVFFIRNTPYKLEFYDDKELNGKDIANIGAFIDFSGSYIMNIDENSEMIKNYIELLKLTNEALELHHQFYKNHSKIVQIVAVEVAKSLFLSQEEIESISLGALLHDIGMVGDLIAMLDKDKLDNKEIDLIKQHPIIGSIMVEPISHIYNISDIIKYHHERFDGLGYPFGLSGIEIPFSAGLVALGEFYAGLTSDRVYRKGKTHIEAVQEIEKLANKYFDKSIVEAFLDVEQSIKVKIEKVKYND